MNSISELRQHVDRQKGRRDQLKDSIRKTTADLKQAKLELENAEQAQTIIREVGQKTQQELEYHISNVVTAALEAVFPNPYNFKVQFVQRRGKTECDPLFERDGETFHPLTASGGGAVDVAAFALRVAALSMQKAKSRPVLLLDEPFKHLSSDLQDKAGEMLNIIAERTGFQIIMISHDDKLIDGADKYFTVSLRRGISHIS